MKQATLRLEYGHRGGGIEIAVDRIHGYKTKYKGVKMTAYQNYLGGGILGSIQNDCNKSEWSSDEKLVKLADRLSRYFHELTRHSDDEWEDADYESIQRRPTSAY